MLVLSRHVGEKIIIGTLDDPERIEIVVVEIRGDKVRLGIEAPAHVVVAREEIAEGCFEVAQKKAREDAT